MTEQELDDRPKSIEGRLRTLIQHNDQALWRAGVEQAAADEPTLAKVLEFRPRATT